ncbi:Uma2 family endonuclease [uncultured Acetatifactor sp.]|uniref:Uma2 family endonuclease n=1 Tax=uncultured Acetatifactor sp. TaxID=1671927 RepID=UPI002604DA6B|nr:Uma2 family endonuclease [uncultured Acetatifactor sp.]MCI8696063.1 Uma2 family endonuclease [Lachnospiraceae bacterium]
MSLAAKQPEYYTMDDINNLPEGKRAELIDGELYMMAAPGMMHQRILMELAFRIRDYIGKNNGDCEVFPAPFAVFLNADDRIYVEPDISVICDKEKLTEEGCKGAPDWIIEVVSPTSRPMDYNKKLFKYRTAGVREYWIVDYERDLITVYDFEHDEMTDFTLKEKVKAGIYEDLEIDFSQMNL